MHDAFDLCSGSQVHLTGILNLGPASTTLPLSTRVSSYVNTIDVAETNKMDCQPPETKLWVSDTDELGTSILVYQEIC